jgi:hypothetical protein
VQLTRLREHFGDETAWYYAFETHYTKCLACLAPVGLLFSMVEKICRYPLGAAAPPQGLASTSVPESWLKAQVLWFSIIILWGTSSLLFWGRRKGELQTRWDLHNTADVATARMEHRPDPTQLSAALDELLRRVDEEKAQAEKVVVFNLPAASSCTTRECSAALLAVLLTAVVFSCLWCHRRGNENENDLTGAAAAGGRQGRPRSTRTWRPAHARSGVVERKCHSKRDRTRRRACAPRGRRARPLGPGGGRL